MTEQLKIVIEPNEDSDWYMTHHPGRIQPWTVQRRLHYRARPHDRRYQGYETLRFYRTEAEAQAYIAKLET